MPTLSLEASKKVYELLGDTCDAEKYWMNQPYGSNHRLASLEEAMELNENWYRHSINGWTRERLRLTPAPNLPELIRLLPKIARKKGLRPHNEYMGDEEPMEDHLAKEIAVLMMDAPTQEEGMAKVSEYLEKLL